MRDCILEQRSARLPSIHSRALMHFGAALAALCICHCALADTVQFQGRAVDPASGRLLYREVHLVQSDNGRNIIRVVLYQCESGATFARKRVDYANSMIAPDFELVDVRSGYREGLRRINGKLILFARANATAVERDAAIAPGNALVADAGFDEFVTRNWTALAAGQTLALDFAIPTRGETYRFKLAREAQTTINGVPAMVFRMNLGGLLSLFAPHIDVTYGMASHHLLRFEGITDISGSDGRRMVARIDFPTGAPAEIAPTALNAALALPLVACTSAH
jgi:hypothetical protein